MSEDEELAKISEEVNSLNNEAFETGDKCPACPDGVMEDICEFDCFCSSSRAPPCSVCERSFTDLECNFCGFEATTFMTNF